ncbi:hypothetical protein ACIQUC_09250 [Curtobacterium sp. NPDC098951]|uniref:hypothetical protein n=1 Tax=Curtobacterium sp. NPDC098951 TaxID=3363974 RepID=UPI00381993DA
MFDLVDALAAIAAVTIALTYTSLDRRTAAVIGAAGSTIGVFLAWVAAPGAWTGTPVVPWIAAVLGAAGLVAGWSAVRLYDGVFAPPRVEQPDDTGAVTTIGR